MLTQRLLVSAILLAIAAGLPASASSCSNPCTGSAASGSDSTDRSNFNSDNGDLIFNNITFDGATGSPYLAGGLNSGTESGTLLYGASFVGCFSSYGACGSNSAGLKIANIGNWGGGTNPTLQISNGNFQSGGNTDTFTIMFPPNTFAFAFDLLDQNNANSGAPLFVHITSDAVTLAPILLPGSDFYGYRSSSPISVVSVWPGYSGVQLALDNVELGGAADTPEAATFLLVGSGLFTLGYARRRKRALQLAAA